MIEQSIKYIQEHNACVNLTNMCNYMDTLELEMIYRAKRKNNKMEKVYFMNLEKLTRTVLNDGYKKEN